MSVERLKFEALKDARKNEPSVYGTQEMKYGEAYSGGQSHQEFPDGTRIFCYAKYTMQGLYEEYFEWEILREDGRRFVISEEDARSWMRPDPEV